MTGCLDLIVQWSRYGKAVFRAGDGINGMRFVPFIRSNNKLFSLSNVKQTCRCDARYRRVGHNVARLQDFTYVADGSQSTNTLSYSGLG